MNTPPVQEIKMYLSLLFFSPVILAVLPTQLPSTSSHENPLNAAPFSYHYWSQEPTISSQRQTSMLNTHQHRDKLQQIQDVRYPLSAAQNTYTPLDQFAIGNQEYMVSTCHDNMQQYNEAIHENHNINLHPNLSQLMLEEQEQYTSVTQQTSSCNTFPAPVSSDKLRASSWLQASTEKNMPSIRPDTMLQHPEALDIIDQYLLCEDAKYEAEASIRLVPSHEGQDVSHLQNTIDFQAASTLYSFGEYLGKEDNRFWHNPTVQMEHVNGIHTAMTEESIGNQASLQDNVACAPLKYDFSVGSSLSIPALQKDGVIGCGYPISAAFHAIPDSNTMQGSSTETNLRDSNNDPVNVDASMLTFSPVEFNSLQAQSRRKRKTFKRTRVRKKDSVVEQSSPLRRIYEIQTEGAVGHAKPEVQEGETEVNFSP